MPAILDNILVGDNMKNSKDLLASVLKTTQMGQIGIRSVLKNPLRATLKTALKSQLEEYDAIEKEALSIAAARGWKLEDLDPAIKSMTDIMVKTKLYFGDMDSKAAALMIQGNTRGMIKSLKNLHHINNSDQRISLLTQKLLDCEEENIRQMQGFL